MTKLNEFMKSIKNFDENTKIIFAYRYISLLFTSLVYIFIDNSDILVKALVIFCLFVLSTVLNYLYYSLKDNKKGIFFITLIETIGNTLILIPTGGFKSPYVWYALNTVLITIRCLGVQYCFVNLTLYLILSTIISKLTSERVNIASIVTENLNFLLGLILVAISTELVVQMDKKIEKERDKLEHVNNDLNEANERLRKSISYIMSLYQAVHYIANENDEERVRQILLIYTRKILNGNMSFFCYKNDDEDLKVKVSGNSNKDIEEDIISAVKKQWFNMISLNKPEIVELGSSGYIVTCVFKNSSLYGVLGINKNSLKAIESYEQIKLLGEISSIVLERIRLQEVNDKLLISEEQNRIANEIHDGVIQGLFAVSCSLRLVTDNKKYKLSGDLKEKLDFMKEHISNSISELRETIYGMSYKKGAKNVFFEDIRIFANNMSKSCSLPIDLNLNGNHEILNYNLKKTLNRIVKEGIGNAIRHSKCSNIIVDMNILDNIVELSIEDNGIGLEKGKKVTGIGMKNMSSLVKINNGEIDVKSSRGKGTFLKVRIPILNY
ncbi:MAG: histidine kinase [Clostridiales bacterium]